MEWFQYVIILAILIIIALVVIKVNQKDFSSEVNKLIKYYNYNFFKNQIFLRENLCYIFPMWFPSGLYQTRRMQIF